VPKITKKKLNIGHLSELSLILHSIIRSFFLLNNINNQMFAINFLPLVPMRAADSERSEMISQLLYGRRFPKNRRRPPTSEARAFQACP
jgi:hypothetical protein